MNKQELINHIKDQDEWSGNHRFILIKKEELISMIEDLDQPQKVKVPAYVAEWIEEYKKDDRTLYQVMNDIECAVYYHKGKDLAYKWLFSNEEAVEHQKIFATAYANDYEVEEEPKYYVNIGDLYLKEPLADTNDFTISMTWNKDYAYQFDSWNMAREHTSELGGTVVKAEV